MSTALPAEVLQDDVAVSLARALAAANKRARESGVDVGQSLIMVTQHPSDGKLLWRISYGPKDYVGRRGGDFIVEVDPTDARIMHILRGQ